MLFKGMEIINGNQLEPGSFYNLEHHGSRVIKKRNGKKETRVQVIALELHEDVSEEDFVAEIRVFCDRNGRRRAQEVNGGLGH